MIKKIISNKKGAAALISVVIVSAAAIIISRGLAFLALSEIDGGVSADNESIARYYAEGCIEETIKRIQYDPSYSANDFVLDNRGNYCLINVSANGDERTITAKGTHGAYNKTIEAVVNAADDLIDIVSWQEIEN